MSDSNTDYVFQKWEDKEIEKAEVNKNTNQLLGDFLYLCFLVFFVFPITTICFEAFKYYSKDEVCHKSLPQPLTKEDDE